MSDLFTITLPDAQGRIADWLADQAQVKAALPAGSELGNLPPITTQSFTLKIQDVHGLMNRIFAYNAGEASTGGLIPFPEPIVSNPVNAVRFFLGKESFPGMPVSPQASLMAVAVTEFDPAINQPGNNMLNLPVAPGMPEEASIFDFSYPCPPTCTTL